MNLQSLVNPLGAGIALVFWWYAVVSLVALIVATQAPREEHLRKRHALAWRYVAATMATLASCFVMTFYVPHALSNVRTPDDYRRIGLLMVAVGAFAVLVGSVGFVMKAVYAFSGRRSSVWQGPLFWLVLTQYALMAYATLAVNTRWDTYVKLWSYGKLGVEPVELTPSYVTLGIALVCTCLALGGLVVNTGRIPNAGSGRMTWLDHLVIVLSTMNGAPPPWGYNPGDSPDEGDGRRDTNRT